MSLTLKDICLQIVDCPHSTAPDEGIGYPLIRTPNVGKGRLILDGVQRVSEETYLKRNKRAEPRTGDIIFAREAPAGNAALICEGQKVCLGQRTVLIRPDRTKVDPRYLVYYMLAPQQQYELLGTANGATVAHVNIPTIKNMPVELPNLDTQRKVADILTVYDDLIENSQKQISLLEETAQRLYKEWFVDLKFPGYETTKIIDDIPQDWHYGSLKEIASFRRGTTITKAKVKPGNIPVVAGGIEPAYYHNTANTKAPVITVSGSGANAGFTNLFLVDVFASDCSFVDKGGTDYVYFVYCFLKHNKDRIMNLQKGSAQPHVYAKDLNGLEMTIPSKKYLNDFTENVGPIFDEIKILQGKIKLVREARDRLLPKLMNGEIAV